MLDNSENVLLTLSLNDRFGDQGIVGLCFALNSKKNKGEMVIDTFLMSCRALGRGAEDALWSVLLDYVNIRKYTLLRSSFIASKKNMQVADFFDRLGMAIESIDSKEKKYLMKLPYHVDVPDWIKVDLLEK